MESQERILLLDHFCSHRSIKLPMKFFAPIMRYCKLCFGYGGGLVSSKTLRIHSSISSWKSWWHRPYVHHLFSFKYPIISQQWSRPLLHSALSPPFLTHDHQTTHNSAARQTLATRLYHYMMIVVAVSQLQIISAVVHMQIRKALPHLPKN